MDRHLLSTLLVLGTLSFLAAASAAPLRATWVNGDFELGGALWTPASTTTFGDADADGDKEASIAGCGDSAFQLSRGRSAIPVRGTSDLSFTIESGQIDFWDIRAILLDSHDPEHYVNNFLAPADWLDDQVIAWYSWSSPLSGEVRLDPTQATAFNVANWGQMSGAEREARLSQMHYSNVVIYGCTTNGATLDDFAWEL